MNLQQEFFVSVYNVFSTVYSLILNPTFQDSTNKFNGIADNFLTNTN